MPQETTPAARACQARYALRSICCRSFRRDATEAHVRRDATEAHARSDCRADALRSCAYAAKASSAELRSSCGEKLPQCFGRFFCSSSAARARSTRAQESQQGCRWFLQRIGPSYSEPYRSCFWGGPGLVSCCDRRAAPLGPGRCFGSGTWTGASPTASRKTRPDLPLGHGGCRVAHICSSL